MALQCFRNSRLEDLHAGISPSSASGDYSDVTVSSPYGTIPWPNVSRLNDDEMKQLMIDVVNRAYRFIHTLFDEEAGAALLVLLAQHDPLPRWNDPTLEPTHNQATRQQPSAEEAMRLSGAFDELFSTVTGYDALDQRIAKTQANKGPLLMVLRHPETPLHNNPAELGARGRVRKRVVSYGPRSPQGAKAWDTFQTLLGTAKKLGVNFFHYLRDRIGGARKMPSLAELIQQRANDLQLGSSWESS
ncbi:MAG: hypothetical protein ACLQU1_36980 [Bryobacteraceae bacterium]